MTENPAGRRFPLLAGLDPTGRDPLRRSLLGTMDRLMGELAREWPQRPAPLAGPTVDITETDAEYRFWAELPGVAKQDVSVDLEEGVLVIRGEKRCRRDEKTERGRRLECSYGAFSRSFTLPPDADCDRITSRFEDGILSLVIPKRQTQPDTTP